MALLQTGNYSGSAMMNAGLMVRVHDWSNRKTLSFLAKHFGQ